jgi:hypothetical protein
MICLEEISRIGKSIKAENILMASMELGVRSMENGC